jgi:hypothetical protein
LHAEIAELQGTLKDKTASYQAAWRDAVVELLADRKDDYDFLSLLEG